MLRAGVGRLSVARRGRWYRVGGVCVSQAGGDSMRSFSIRGAGVVMSILSLAAGCGRPPATDGAGAADAAAAAVAPHAHHDAPAVPATAPASGAARINAGAAPEAPPGSAMPSTDTALTAPAIPGLTAEQFPWQRWGLIVAVYIGGIALWEAVVRVFDMRIKSPGGCVSVFTSRQRLLPGTPTARASSHRSRGCGQPTTIRDRV